MSASIQCPICKNAHGRSCEQIAITLDRAEFKCAVCGHFQLTQTALAYLSGMDTLSQVQRAALSHTLRQDGGNRPPVLASDWLKRFLSDARLPTPARQAINAIRYIGDHIVRTGEKLPRLPIGLYAVIGAPNPELAAELIIELINRGLLAGQVAKVMSSLTDVLDVNLTLAGWERFDAERSGHISSRVGFLALKFGDRVLDEFVRDVVKPCIRDELGFPVFDMRDVARAGIIDNLMRQQIRDSAFVLVDLTHDNAGAYWEAGYAEGLGKPVIYICEQAKFKEAQTHFDTNHCTTVVWSATDPSEFKAQLLATLRRSLNLFSTQ